MEPIDNNLLYYFVVGVSLLIVATFVAYSNTRLERRKAGRQEYIDQKNKPE